MSLPFAGPVTTSGNCCDRIPGTQPPGLAPYVRSIFSLQGIVGMEGDDYIDISSSGNTIIISLDTDALIPLIIAEEGGDLIALEGGITPGTGTVQSVELSSSTLSIGGDNPIITDGTITVNLTGATASIQGLTTAANKMIYTTASNTYAVTDLTAFARTILDDANGAAVVTTIGAQPLSADLTAFVTNASWSGSDLTLAGDLAVVDLTATSITATGTLLINGDTVVDGDLGVGGTLTADILVGNGAAINALNAGNITTGTLVAARGGTGFSSYAVGDLLYASTTSALSKLADVAAGSFLRSGGVSTAPAWSSTTLPNTVTTGDLLYASSNNVVSALADIATGNALISGGVGTAPSWGKITSSHTTGLAASGSNGDITALSSLVGVSSSPTFSGNVTLEGILYDANDYEGDTDALLKSTTTGVEWTRDINVDELRIDVSLSLEGTIMGAGTTGDQTINKPSGTVRIAAAGTDVTVTNSLCTTSSRVIAVCSTDDADAYVKNVAVSSGSFIITLGAPAAAETEVSWMLFTIT